VTKCRACRAVSEASDYYPPSLPLPSSASQMPSVSQLAAGTSWTSDRCETRPYGIFLIRRLTFGSSAVTTGRAMRTGQDDGKFIAPHDWWEERVQYFTDPGCRNPYFSVYGRGRYTVGNAVPDFGRDVAFEADFEVAQLKLTINDKRLLPVVRSCGVATKSRRESTSGRVESSPGVIRNNESQINGSSVRTDKWSIGVERDVTSYGGCPTLDVRMPKSPIPQLIAVLRRGGPQDVVLLIGQQPMDPVDHVHIDDVDLPKWQLHRPTSFYPDLRKCIDGPRPATSIYAGRGGEGGKSAGAPIVGSRRPWRHVASYSSSGSTLSNTVHHLSISDVTYSFWAIFGLIRMTSAITSSL